ncbi:IclR family transcriptional regulator [Pseudonocardia kunmingensis]|nr:IclR family transcriptional regulator [Pseudonocardia kunmingensis]
MPMTETASGRADGGVRSIMRAVDLLDLFDAEHPWRPLREIVTLTELPKTTVVRLLATLEGLGLVADRQDGTYGLGARFLQWVRLSEAMWEVSEGTRRVMRELVDRCGETVNLYIRQDASRVSIAQQEGTTTVRSVVTVGAQLPLTQGATAKVLLGAAPAPVWELLERRHPEVDLAALRREVAGTAEIGYSVTHGERELGASSVAVPIRRHGRVVASLSVSGPTSRFTADRIGGYVDAVTDAAQRISAAGLGSVEVFL